MIESNKLGEDWPEELKYAERMLDGQEILFGLNLYAHKRNEIDYSTLCLETADMWLDRVESSDKYSEIQNIAITFVLKGRRLLRAAQLQIFKGYLPEAEILSRSVFEIQLVLGYILNDPTGDRIKKYLTFERKKIWDFKTLCNEMFGDQGYEVYAELSQYPHPFNIGRTELIYQGKLQSSAIQNYEKAGGLLVHFSNSAIGLCEQSNILFPENTDWEKKHEEIYDTEIFKKNFLQAQKMIDEGNEGILKMLSAIEKSKKNYNKA